MTLPLREGMPGVGETSGDGPLSCVGSFKLRASASFIFLIRKSLLMSSVTYQYCMKVSEGVTTQLSAVTFEL